MEKLISVNAKTQHGSVSIVDDSKGTMVSAITETPNGSFNIQNMLLSYESLVILGEEILEFVKLKDQEER